ncbi:potassium voltage-gated channel subfamily A member 1-like [Actinia tenebrosa]|uniref:Potassium voltage-gated channel subfamily A member 1-like n=1 Tax=Actinia tenebrosa TaxID=6105 RepID=A0A6P8HGK1_ACTTE|nr:potassium voltage-gated channel subfamily A member 1-like [Actinia tenebrosa]
MSHSQSNLYLSDRVVINVSGERYETLESTLSRYPNTLLGCPTKRSQYFDHKQKEYFFNRNRQVFDAILFYYQSYGRLVKPDLISDDIFMDEIRFFEIQSDFVTAREKLETSLSGNPHSARSQPQNQLQRQIWILFTYAGSSFWARILGVWSVTVIVMSVVIPCIESLEYDFHESVGTMRSVLEGNTYAVLESGCYIWFTFELCVRFASAPKKTQFFRQPLNIIDFITVVSYYLVLLIEGSRSGSLSAMRVARILRVLRIFKLSRYSSGMRILLFTFLTSLKELTMFLIFLLISVLLSSSAAYYAEYGEPKSNFTSIPATFWWSVGTVTTLGYGDHYPQTLAGKLVGGALSIIGVLILALPVFLFVTNFKKVLGTHFSLVNDDDDGTDQEDFRRHRLGIRRLNFS